MHPNIHNLPYILMPFIVLRIITAWAKKSNPITGGDPELMAFNNLDGRILLLLAKKWKEKKTSGPYRTATIYKGYSTLPDDYIARELNKLDTNGLITFTPQKNRFYLEDKGVARIRSFISPDRWNSIGV